MPRESLVTHKWCRGRDSVSTNPPTGGLSDHQLAIFSFRKIYRSAVLVSHKTSNCFVPRERLELSSPCERRILSDRLWRESCSEQVVPRERLELSSPCERRILSPLRIPFRHRGTTYSEYTKGIFAVSAELNLKFPLEAKQLASNAATAALFIRDIQKTIPSKINQFIFEAATGIAFSHNSAKCRIMLQDPASRYFSSKKYIAPAVRFHQK